MQWTFATSESEFHKINSIYQTLSRYALWTISALPIMPICSPNHPIVEEKVALQSRNQGSRSHVNTIASPWLKQNIDSP